MRARPSGLTHGETARAGTVLNANATSPTLGAPAVQALSIMKQLASSVAADPSLSVEMENQNRLAMRRAPPRSS